MSLRAIGAESCIPCGAPWLKVEFGLLWRAFVISSFVEIHWSRSAWMESEWEQESRGFASKGMAKAYAAN
jgi:hypothetical protein